MMIELIDRETTIKALVNEAKIIDGKRFEEPNLQHVFDFGGIIRSMPTVQAVPIEEIKTLINDIEVMRTSPALIDNDDVQKFAENVLYALNRLIKESDAE